MKLFVLILAVALLAGCSWTQDLLVKTKPVDRIPLVLPDVDRYHHRQIEWQVVTKENVAEVFAELQKTGKPLAIIGLSGNDYELLSLNVSDQQLLIKQLNAIIAAYKTYYIAVEARDEKIQVVE
jgi:hypothetical protein